MGVPQALSLGSLSHQERDCDLESPKNTLPFPPRLGANLTLSEEQTLHF